jgi:stearoyl-CoA desaturase (Delta-9 desaturase)
MLIIEEESVITPSPDLEISSEAETRKTTDDITAAAPQKPYAVRQLTDYAIPIFAGHLIALFAFVPGFITWTNFAILLVGVLVFGQGINLGYHRLLAHRSLRVPKWLEYFYVWLAICCSEETPAKWVSTHRRHHKFFWGHMGWLVFRRNGRSELRVEDRLSGDLFQDPFYRQLELKWWLPTAIYLGHVALFYVVALAVYLTLGYSLGSASFHAAGVMMWGAILRTVVVWHITWSVNSLSHTFGYQNYKTGEQSRNNWLVALLASGEGWHNNHHHDPASASVQHRWWEFDLTYYHVRALEMLGLAKAVIRPRHVRHAEREEVAS